MEKALGMKDVANSVLAPMPCKVLRVEVQAGDEVEKDQPLVVIESMKMETVIRSPQKGKIARVVHQQGVSFLFSYPFLAGYTSSLMVEFENYANKSRRINVKVALPW